MSDAPRSRDDSRDARRPDARERPAEPEDARDAGRTGGGGSLGHDQPEDVKGAAPLRNATGSDRDPVMPEDDATLKTKI